MQQVRWCSVAMVQDIGKRSMLDNTVRWIDQCRDRRFRELAYVADI
jgi:hypothetical protein